MNDVMEQAVAVLRENAENVEQSTNEVAQAVAETETQVQETTEQPNAETDAISEQPQASETTTTSQAATEEAQQPQVTETPQEIDYAAILGGLSKGAISSVDDFNSMLEKANGYGELTSKLQETEQKLVDVYPNEYVKTLSELYKGGASTEQISMFQKLNALGDISKLSDKDAIVYQKVQQGWSEDVARDAVELDYDFEGLDEDSREYRILQQKMSLDANTSRQELQKQIVDISASVSEKQQATVEAQQKAEQERLDNIARQETFNKQVKSVSNDLAKSLTGLGEITIREEKDKDSIKLTENFPDDFNKFVPQLVEQYLLGANKELNEETLKEASGYVKNVYWAQHGETIVRKAVDQAIALERQAVTNEYENRTGLPKGEPKPAELNSQNEYHNFLKDRVAGGNRN